MKNPATSLLAAGIMMATMHAHAQGVPYKIGTSRTLKPYELDENALLLQKGDNPADITVTLTPEAGYKIDDTEIKVSAPGVFWQRTVATDFKHEYEALSLKGKDIYNYDEYVLYDATLWPLTDGRGNAGLMHTVPSAAGIASIDIKWLGDPKIEEKDEERTNRVFRIPTPSNPVAQTNKFKVFRMRPTKAEIEGLPFGVDQRKNNIRTLTWDTNILHVCEANAPDAILASPYEIADSREAEEPVFLAFLATTNVVDKFSIKVEGPDCHPTDTIYGAAVKMALDGPRVYDPKLTGAGPIQITYAIQGFPDPIIGDLKILEGGTEVAVLIPKGPIATGTKEWNGKWDKTNPGNEGKYADSKAHTVKLTVYADGGEVTAEYPLYVVRLGVHKFWFIGDEPLMYHKTTPTNTANFPFGQGEEVWLIENLDFLHADITKRPCTEARVGQATQGESYWSFANKPVFTAGVDKYFDDDGNGNYDNHFVQVNFPHQIANPNPVEGVEKRRFNRPVAYVMGSNMEIKFEMGNQSISDLTRTNFGVGYTVPEHRIAVFVENADPKPGSDTENIQPGKTYQFTRTDTLPANVGLADETFTFTFKYERDDPNDPTQKIWEDISGNQKTTHKVYRLAAAPDAQAKSGDRLWLKIVDFTCRWGAGQTTPEGVFHSYWDNDNFWTPITNPNAPGAVDNAGGFHGVGDYKENHRVDFWGNQPKCYTYQHTMGDGNGFNVDWLLDFNQGRCEALGEFLRVFMGTHGLAPKRQSLPAMKWRFVSKNLVSFVNAQQANILQQQGLTASGTPAQPGDVWYGPMGFWVKSHGQANPCFTKTPYLYSYFRDKNHVFVNYDNRFYDPSYEHPGGKNFATINEMADAAISHFYYNKKFVFIKGRFQDQSSTLPRERIWAPQKYNEVRCLKVSNTPKQQEFEEVKP